MSRNDGQKPQAYVVPAVDKALRILRALSDARGGLGVSGLAEQLDLPKSTVYTILQTLQLHHFAELDGQGKWAPGLGAFEVGCVYASKMDLVSAFKSAAAQVVARCGETVQLSVLNKREIVIIAKVEGTQPVNAMAREGTRFPAHTTASGKGMLAALSEEQLDELYHGVALSSRTARSITALTDLKAELARTRAQGFAYESEETTLGLHCVARVIVAGDGRAVASIGILVPSQRMSSARTLELKGLVVEAANAISARISFNA